MSQLGLRAVCAALVFHLCFAAASARAQTAGTPADYSKQAAIYEKISTKMNFENDGTTTQEYFARIKLQSQAALQSLGTVRLSYAASDGGVEIDYVRVVKPDGTVVTTPLTDVLDIPAEVTQIAPLYSDWKEKRVPVKGLQVGDVLEFQARWLIRRPDVPGQFWYETNFNKDAIVLDEQLEVRFPSARKVKVKSTEVQPEIKEENGQKVYRWQTANLSTPDSQNPRKEPKPEAKLPAVQVTSFQSWDEVAKWYRDLQESRSTATSDIRVKAAALTQGDSTDDAKIRTLYQYVSTQFRYIGIDFGIGRLQAHSATEVLEKGYGDCKDKETLLAALLSAVGIQSQPALVNASLNVDPDMPSLGQFNHVISVVDEGSKRVWLDTTTEVGPYGYLLPNLRDKKALIITPDGRGEMVTTPPVPLIGQSITYNTEGKLDEGGTFTGAIHSTYQGDVEVVLRDAFRRTPEAQWQQIVQNMAAAVGFGGTVSDIKVSSPDAIDQPFEISYQYERKSYGDWADHKITFPLPPLGFISVGAQSLNSDEPLQLGTPTTYSFESKITLPAGYSVGLPANVDLTNSAAEYHATYATESGAIVTRRRLVNTIPDVPVADRTEFRVFAAALLRDQTALLPLHAPTDGKTVNSEATHLLDQAADQGIRQDYLGAQSSLRQAVAKDPTNKEAWLQLGQLNEQLGVLTEAIDDFNRVIDLDPKSVQAYKDLAAVQGQSGRHEDELKTWEAAAKVAPDDGDIAIRGSSAFMDEGLCDEAAKLLEPEEAAHPGDAGPPYLLAECYLKSPTPEKAVPQYVKVEKLGAKIEILAVMSRDLANKGVGLEDALRFETKVVQFVEERLQQVSSADPQFADSTATMELAEQWSVLGKIQLLRGQTETAQKYLSAAWSLNRSDSAADGLGQIYERQGKKTAAMNMYAMALASNSAPMPDTVKRFEALAGPSAPLYSAISRAKTEIGRLNSVKVPRVRGATNGTAELLVVIKPGGLVSGHFVRGFESFRGADISGAKLSITFPDDKPGTLVIDATLDCNPSQQTCDLILHPRRDIRLLNAGN